MVVDSAPLRVAVDLGGRQPSLAVAGKADHSNICPVLSVLDTLAGENDRCVSLDLHEMESSDAVAVEKLACSACVLKDQGKRLHLGDTSDDVRGLVDGLGLAELFCDKQGGCLECEPYARTAAVDAWSGDRFCFSSSIDCCQKARNRVDQVADRVGFSKSDREDIMLAVGEAVTNAIQHGQNGSGPESFSVGCVASSGKLCVLVTDHGCGFDPEALPGLDDVMLLERGRGIHCIRAVMDELTFHFGGGTTVRMVKYSGHS